MKKEMKGIVWLMLVVVLMVLSGCEKGQSPVGSNSGVQSVSLSAVFSRGGATTLAKTEGVMSTDSLVIDSAIVIFQRIKFESHVDSVMIDSTGNHDSDDDGHGDDVTFKGPFVVHVRDTMTIDFASQTLPAGVYDGIKFKIHTIHWGERFEDSDDFNHHPKAASDSLFMGAGIVVWGKVNVSGTWRNFTYLFRGEAEYKLKGNFKVLSPTSVVNVVLRFDIGSWFRNPSTGALLDPTNTSFRNQELIDWSIRHSFQMGKGGRDHDRNGWPDND